MSRRGRARLRPSRRTALRAPTFHSAKPLSLTMSKRTDRRGSPTRLASCSIKQNSPQSGEIRANRAMGKTQISELSEQDRPGPNRSDWISSEISKFSDSFFASHTHGREDLGRKLVEPARKSIHVRKPKCIDTRLSAACFLRRYLFSPQPPKKFQMKISFAQS